VTIRAFGELAGPRTGSLSPSLVPVRPRGAQTGCGDFWWWIRLLMRGARGAWQVRLVNAPGASFPECRSQGGVLSGFR
jgi:hypothetical protein